ncbi:unnamed protein product [Trichobilharzia szidati]|nr:unnamed protein product [Trichobilharzia szidati]
MPKGLEEIQSDGDLPQCPVCGCVWIELPNFDSHVTTTNENVNATSTTTNNIGGDQQQEQRLTKTHHCDADNNDDATGDDDIDNVDGDEGGDEDDNSNTDRHLPSHQSHRGQSTTNQRQHEHHHHHQQKQSSNDTPCSSILNQSIKNIQGIDSTDFNGNITMMNSVLSNPPFSEYNSCISAFSLEIANALVSYDWTIRQYALQQTTHLTIRQVLLARQCHLHSDHYNLVCSINSTTNNTNNNNNNDNEHCVGVGVGVNDPACGCCCCCTGGGAAVSGSSPSSSSKNHHHHQHHQCHPHRMYTGPDCVRIMFKLIQHMLDDPVDAIFTDALRAFRELLGYLVCYNKETQSALQKAIGPILRRLLRFVGGSSNLWSLRSPESLIHVNNPPIAPLSLHQDDENRTVKLSHKEMKKFDHHITSQSINKPVETSGIMNNELDILQTKSHLSLHPSPLSTAAVASPVAVPAPANFRDRSNLALATLIELAKGQSGALALGREVHCASQCLPISGIQHMVRFVLSSAKFHATHLIGRLTIVDKLIRMHQTNIQQLSIQQQQQQTTTGNKSFLSNETINTGCHNATTNTTDISSGEKVSVPGGGGGETPSPPISSPPPPLLSSSSTTRTTAMNDQSLARRHLCSTIVFARRHLLPIYPKPDNMTMCFPYHYQLQATGGGVTHAANNENNNNNGFSFKSPLGPGLTAAGGTAAVSVATLTGTPVTTTTTAALSQPNGLSVINYFHHTQYKANRIARRVFLTACRALLTWRNEEPVNDHCDPIPPSTFNANTFIESEINRLDAPLATWFRNRLCLLLYPSDTTGNILRGIDQHSSMIKSLVSSPSSTSHGVVIPSSRSYNAALTSSSSANSITQNQNNNDSKNKHKYPSSQVQQPHQQQQQQQQHCTSILHNSSTSSSPIASSIIPTKLPPIPPPRRVTINNFELNDNNKKDLVNKYDPLRHNNEQRDQNPVDNTCDNNNNNTDDKNIKKIKSQILNSSFVRIALEPAYDLVALSETGNYSSASEFEDEDEDEDEDEVGEEEEAAGDVDDEADVAVDDVDGNIRNNKKRNRKKEKTNNPSEPIYTGRSLGSEADLQCEQVTVLRNALTRSTNQLKPLLPIPGLSFVMNSFEATKKLPNSDEYYESVDWVRGPILGHGAFSQCYQARDVRTGLLLAVKRIRLGRNSLFSLYSSDNKKKTHQSTPVQDPVMNHPSRPLSPTSLNQLTEVETEVRIMLQLDHPNVLRLFGAVHCVKRGFVDLFIEWMPGGSITSLLQQYGAFNESITLNYGIQLIRGLAYLHKHGILHRDLKGANLLIDSTGAVIKISDFGASARLSGEQSVAGQFQGQVIGTFSFMAPEVLRGETYGRACDIWSVGCCLIEMLTSKPPWHDARLTNRYALMYTIATSNSPPTYPEGLSAGLISVLDACFARNPVDRPTANQLLTFKIFADLISQQVVTSSIDEEKTQPQPPPPPPPPQSQPQPQPVQKQKEPVPLQSLPSSSPSLKAITGLNTSKNRDKTLKSQMNTTKSNTKSSSTSFSYQRFLKTFQSNKNSPSLNHKKFIRLHEVLQDSKEEYQRKQPQEDMMMMMAVTKEGKCERHQQMPITSPSDENSKCIRQLSDHHQHIQQQQQQHQQQQESNQHVDDTVLLTRRQKFRRPTLPGLSFHRKYRSRSPVAISFN